MNNSIKNLNECWIFIDDSGNIELSDKCKNFTYAALVFYKKEDIENFRINYKRNLMSLFGSDEEKKGADRIQKNKRIKIYNCILNTKCDLFFVTENKTKSYKLKEIEEDYNESIKLINLTNKTLKSKRLIKKIRKKEYGKHKTYLIGQLVSLIIQKKLFLYKSIKKINILSDKEYLYITENYETIEDYLKNGQKYLKLFNYEFSFKMEDSKKDYCLQGSDFLAYSVYRKYNEYDKEFYNYLDAQKNIIYKEFPFINNNEESELIDKITLD